ncbi:MAG: hypothetical protein HY076_04800 [Candidatus Eisenbacteria bacterium]|uniref:Lipoprotein n=1 Tax=Eiseniibacteriota bacterium TaxID=2212470 RepID=A0A9D6QJS7_UNCEI|nr:hypothetical protein [Candidatus Eisenbacteria bacterium]
MRSTYRLTALALTMLSLSCASAHQLARHSERELAAGDLRPAYQHARAALIKDPAKAEARGAFTRAATQLVLDLQTRVINVATVDTIAAARQSLEIGQIRGDAARLGVAIPADPVFAKHQAAFLAGAAGAFYTRAERELSARQPKAAWADFLTAQDFVPGYRDVGRRIDQAFGMAVATVAILPWTDEAGVPGISRALSDRVYSAVAPHIPSNEYRFTRLVDRDRVYGRMTLAEVDEMSRDDAVTIGRRVGADEVVMGRVYGLRANTGTNRFDAVIWRRVATHDTSGTADRWVEQDFHAVARERQVDVQYDVEVVDSHDGVTLGKFTRGATAYARVVYTDFDPQGECSDYCLVPPALRGADPERARRIEEDWRQTFGSWTLAALLENARRDRAHTRYLGSDRQAFFADCHQRPVYLGALPGERELAGIALDGVWQPVAGMLKELDAKD